MRVAILPDPEHPRGGFALLSLLDGTAAETATVAIQNTFSGQFLGENGWQPTRAMFGPYPVRGSGDDARILIGPEIVNQLEEYTALRITVGEETAETSWPDDVVPAPGAASIGGIVTLTPRGADAPPVLKAKKPEPEEPRGEAGETPETGTESDTTR